MKETEKIMTAGDFSNLSKRVYMHVFMILGNWRFQRQSDNETKETPKSEKVMIDVLLNPYKIILNPYKII